MFDCSVEHNAILNGSFNNFDIYLALWSQNYLLKRKKESLDRIVLRRRFAIPRNPSP